MSPRPTARSGRFNAGLVTAVGVVLLAVSVVTAITFGPADLGVGQVWSVLASRLHLAGDPGLTTLQVAMVWQLRLPRVLLAAACGASLSICGVIMQSLLRNPLAEPYLLGVSSGASTGAVLVLVLGVGSALGLSGGAFVGALGAFAIMLALAGLAGGTTDKIVLAGVAVTQGFSALTSFIIMVGADANTTRGVLYWLMGSLASASWTDVAQTAAGFAVIMVLALGMAGSLDAFTFGERQAASLGVAVRRTRVTLLVLTALLTAVVVASSGAIGFVGLVLPHMARMLVGSRHRGVLPVSAVLGAIFLLWADTIARSAFAPLEVPVGVITAMVGVPVFAVLLSRRRGSR